MKALIAGVAYSIVAAVVGTILPAFSTGEQFRHPVNLIWGFIYGFGWYAAGFVAGIRSPNVQLFGSLIWPLMIFSATTYLTLLLTPSRTGSITMVIAVASLFFILPEDFILRTWLKYIPVYLGILSAVY